MTPHKVTIEIYPFLSWYRGSCSRSEAYVERTGWFTGRVSRYLPNDDLTTNNHSNGERDYCSGDSSSRDLTLLWQAGWLPLRVCGVPEIDGA